MGVHHPGWGSAPLFLSPEERFFAGVVRTVSLTWRTRTLQPVSYPRRTQLSLLPLWSSPCSLSSGDRPQRSAWGPSVSCLGPGVTASRALSGDVAGRQQLQGSGGKRHSPGSSHMEPTLELTWFWAKLEKVGENAE